MSFIFEWDENKARLNYEKHGISFTVAIRVFENECFIYASPRKTVSGTEQRYVAVGEAFGKTLAVIHTKRHEKTRIISARRARKKEEAAYRSLYGRQSS